MLAAGCNSHRFSKAIDTNRTYAASHVDLGPTRFDGLSSRKIASRGAVIWLRASRQFNREIDARDKAETTEVNAMVSCGLIANKGANCGMEP